MSDIPNDLYQPILLCVPAISLLRFRSVCRDWCRIIDDHLFVNLHLRRPPIGGEHLFIRSGSPGRHLICCLPLASLDDDDDSDQTSNKKSIKLMHAKILITPDRAPPLRNLPAASCHGLILIPSSDKYGVWWLWNPFAGEFLELPVCADFIQLMNERDLAFELADLPFTYKALVASIGLGYDAVNNDFKVVVIAYGDDDLEHFPIYIYSINLNSWRMIRSFDYISSLDYMRNVYGTGVFRNNSLYWMACHEMPQKDVNGSVIVYCMIALDLTTEAFSRVPLPAALENSEPTTKLTVRLNVLGEHLFLSCSYWTEPFISICFDLWMMTTDCGSENKWIRILSSGEVCSKSKDVRPIAYLKNKEHVLLQMGKEELWLWDMKSKCLKRVRILGLSDEFSCQVFPASLVRLKGNSSDYHEGSASEGTSKRKSNAFYAERVMLKKITPYPVISDLSRNHW